ncbi:MAG: aldehyde dehydrogenase [Desulfofustis sp. PB-SRB1]|jgi:D-erythrose 4-phosphate dehydrogenase|nr:aldehyde dehydrogenase [Desulfofustis sp. PB-SRB1]MBM1002720.1 aldehyde dehydrogenase [Desulfofustis sp. PB-SRB1]HBH27239.1 aldehyde dehydrogenase [Desulfofustis sp.]HBH31168.1 aldehyde dehydrogenase [Desulfofustis sp.]
MRIAINGLGRIGRCIVRALYEADGTNQLTLAAINEPAELAAMAHLLRFDSTHGRFHTPVTVQGDGLRIGDDHVVVTQEKDIDRLAWGDLDVDLVLECSGRFTTRADAQRHLARGAHRVLFSCPAQADVDATIIYGLNHHLLSAHHRIIANGSCTSNCISHPIAMLNDAYGIQSAAITTIHSVMNDQPVIDAYHNPDLRKNRASTSSIIPVDTGLAKGLERLFPELSGRFSALAMRVPVANVSAMLLHAVVQRTTTAKEVNTLFRRAAATALEGIVGYTEEPLVSCDFNHDPRSAVIDGSHTKVCNDTQITTLAWFDNEWGFANRMLDTAKAISAL